MKPDRPTFELTIRSERHDASADVRQLRELLKRLLRDFGWRCTACAQVEPKPESQP